MVGLEQVRAETIERQAKRVSRKLTRDALERDAHHLLRRLRVRRSRRLGRRDGGLFASWPLLPPNGVWRRRGYGRRGNWGRPGDLGRGKLGAGGGPALFGRPGGGGRPKGDGG